MMIPLHLMFQVVIASIIILIIIFSCIEPKDVRILFGIMLLISVVLYLLIFPTTIQRFEVCYNRNMYYHDAEVLGNNFECKNSTSSIVFDDYDFIKSKTCSIDCSNYDKWGNCIDHENCDFYVDSNSNVSH